MLYVCFVYINYPRSLYLAGSESLTGSTKIPVTFLFGNMGVLHYTWLTAEIVQLALTPWHKWWLRVTSRFYQLHCFCELINFRCLFPAAFYVQSHASKRVIPSSLVSLSDSCQKFVLRKIKRSCVFCMWLDNPKIANNFKGRTSKHYILFIS